MLVWLHPIKLYCEKVLKEGDKSPTKLQTFYKHLPDCDLAFGLEFLQEIQAHYDNNPKLEMFTKNF
jgi:hypothetical protein